MEYIYSEWKKLLETFQQCVEKDLDEIHQQKAEVQQIKSDIFSRLDDSLFYRNENRIVISAPFQISLTRTFLKAKAQRITVWLRVVCVNALKLTL